MNFIDRLKASADRFKSIVCLGLDPVLEDIPLEGSAGVKIYSFYESILNRMIQTGTTPSAVKPNYAFYAQYGIEGLETLIKIISIFQKEGLPVIFDAKRGDIDKTAKAYAREAFEVFKADAVTLSPYLGLDSVAPFMDGYPDRGWYILTKTSNKSSADLQDIDAGGVPVFMKVAEKIISWYRPGIGSVAGATYPEELSRILGQFRASGKEVPLLIPGVGTQGGDLEKVVRILKSSGDVRIHRINSSSAINYAYKKNRSMHFADAAVLALKDLNTQIGF